MTTTTQQISWLGAGWLSGRPAEAAWTILAAGVAIGLVVIIVSYAFTLVAIPPWRRAVLCLLRFAMWLALFLILAAPTRIERTYDHPAAGRPLAVLVDRSDSMTALDNRQQRRLDDALLKWHRLEPSALKAFGSIKAFAFAQGMAPVAAPEDAAILPGGRTDLFASMQNVLAQAPAGGWGGIVALTDGLDTSGVEVSEALRATARAALSAGTPLYFIVGHNRAIEPPFFRLREFNVPAQTVPHSIIRLDAIFDSFQTDESTVSVQLTAGGKALPSEPLRVEAGRHIETWSAEFPAESAGTVEFELRAGKEVARAELRVGSPPASNRILYDEGALDWGYRFLADILRLNDRFSVTPVFDFPNAGIALPPGAIERMPSDSRGLEPFSIVVLANAAASQFEPAQQDALTQWVNGGGVLIFLTPDDDSTRGFAGSELEKMLPVVFMPPGPGSEVPLPPVPPQAQRPRPLGVGSRDYTPTKPPALIPFAWEDTPRVREIFANAPAGGLAGETPKFSTYAHIERAKPGAEVLARHPDENGPDGRGAILLAVQRYGRGKSVVFTTDALWRWRLSQPSESRGVEVFWENFLAWLTRDANPGFYFDHPPIRTPIDSDVTLHLAGAGLNPLRVEASLGSRKIALEELPPDNGSRVFRWRPPSAGLWKIEAGDDHGNFAHAWLTADEASKPGELSGAAPDEELLRTLAAQTSGAVLEAAPAAWRQPPPAAHLLTERRQPLWHRPWVFGVLLGLFGLELLLRRKWRLL